jgi:hypothetical protein
MYDLVSVSDIAAGVVGYVYADTLNTAKPSMQAGQSFVVSLVARIASKAGMGSFMGKLDDGQKNQLIVAIISALACSYKGGSPLKGSLTGMSIDLLAEDLIRMFDISDMGYFQMGTATSNPNLAGGSSNTPPPGFVTGPTHSYAEPPAFMRSRVS